MLEETHGLGASWAEALPVGIARVMLDASGGLYDDRAAGINQAFQGVSTNQIALWGFSRTIVGSEVSMTAGDISSKWRRIASRDALTKANAGHVLTGKLYRGRIVHGDTSETAASGNTQATSIDNNASISRPLVPITSSSIANPTNIVTPVPHGLVTGDVVFIANHSGSTPAVAGEYTATVINTTTFTVPVNVTTGGTGGTFKQLNTRNAVGHLHVTALVLGGYTNVTIKIRHSVDNSVYADAATFTVVSAANVSEELAIANLNRYRAMSWLFNGSGSAMSITPVVAVSHA